MSARDYRFVYKCGYPGYPFLDGYIFPHSLVYMSICIDAYPGVVSLGIDVRFGKLISNGDVNIDLSGS